MKYFRIMTCCGLFAAMSLGASADVVDGPVIQVDPNGVTPLAAEVRFSTDIPVRASIHVTGPDESWSVDFDDYGTEHALPILGMKPNGAYSITVTTTAEGSGETDVLEPELQAVTGPLPDDFPVIDVIVNRPEAMEPGYTLMDRFNRSGGEEGNNYMIILDNQGDVVWYSTEGSSATRQRTNGNLIFRSGPSIREMDLLGNDVNIINPEIENLHHDLFPTGAGTYLSLTREPFTVDDYPTSETDPDAPTETSVIEDDPVVEINADGTVRNIWPLTAILDPTRIGYWSLNVGRSSGWLDWAHANAVSHDTNDDSILVSVRHQDVVAKFSRVTGELKWLLGPHDNWGPEFDSALLNPVGAPFEWQFHQHAQMYTPSGNLLLHDNGNFRASPFDGTEPLPDDLNYTRVVEYEISEEAMLVRQVWEYGASASERIYSSSRGDSDWMLETGNVLITMSAINYVDGVPSADLGFGEQHARVIEVNHSTPAEKVFEIAMYNPDPESRVTVYRAERIPSLYASPDSDGDGIRDRADNCLTLANPLQRDTDHDGFGNLCDADLNNDCTVKISDYRLMKGRFFSGDTNADLNGDGMVNFLDLGIVKTSMFGSPGPSGMATECDGQ